MVDVLKFSVVLEDGVSRAAGLASGSLRRLTTDLEANRSGLRANEAEQLRLQQIQRDFVSNGLGRSKTVDEGLGKLRLEHTVLAGEAKALTAQLKLEQQGISDLGRGAGATGEQLSALAGVAATAGLAIAGSLAAIGAGALVTAFQVTEFNRHTTAAFEALGAQGEGSGRKTLAFLNDLSEKLPQSRDELAKWTKTYEALGITDLGQLRHQIMATASAQAIMGDEGAEAYQHLTERINVAVEAHSGLKLGEKTLKQLYAAGLNVTDVAGRMGVSVQQLEARLKAGTVDAQAFGNAMSDSLIAKGKGPLEAMSSDVATLGHKARETLGHLFDDVDLTPLINVAKEIIHIGDVSEPSGASLKKGITGGLNEIVKDLAIAGHAAEWFFLGLEIKALEAKPTIDGVRRAVHELVDDLLAAGHVLSVIGQGVVAVHNFAYAPVNAAEQFGKDADRAKAAGGDTLEQLGLRGGSAARHFGLAAASPEGGTGGDTDKSVHIQEVHVHVNAPDGVTDAHQISATGLSTALERLQLASGR